MDYNTQRKKLALPEYGRSVHNMIEWLGTIENRDERSRQARAVIAVMGNLNPHLRDVDDFRHKLWDHLQLISDFSLDIDSPYPLPSRESFYESPRRIPIPLQGVKIRHYGRNLQNMVQAVAEREDSPEKKQLMVVLANYMKKSCANWNKEVMPDELIFRDMGILSNGKLQPDSSLKLNNVSQSAGNGGYTHSPANNGKTFKKKGSYINNNNGKKQNGNKPR